MLTITLLSCGSAKEMNETPATPEPPTTELTNVQINDIWVAETILGERFEPNGEKMPQLEIHIKEMRFSGNDGCNNLSGSIKNLDDENVTFGNAAATKMACPDMTVPEQFNNAILKTRKYKIQKLRLYLYDSDGQELMVLKKVD
jgi:heat shock protein HslJ